MNILAKIRAAGAFTKTLLGPRDPVTKNCAFGITQLEGWTEAPEIRVVKESAAHTQVVKRLPALGVLYCYAGPHAGDTFFLSEKRNRVAQDATAQIVLTPAADHSAASYELLCKEDAELIGIAPHPFYLNGRPEYQARLVDYDEVDLCGNRFIYLALGGQS